MIGNQRYVATLADRIRFSDKTLLTFQQLEHLRLGNPLHSQNAGITSRDFSAPISGVSKMISSNFIRTAVIASAMAISGYALAQGPQMKHHGGGAGDMNSMPMGDGMMPGQMQGHGMMMGKGMMGGMGRGMMSRNCPMMGMMMNSEDGETHTAGRIAFLKAELGITKDQQDAFDAYANALKNNLDDMQGMRAKMMTSIQSRTPVERLSSHITVMEGRLATLKEVKPALEKLYGVLSDEQKKKAKDIIGGMGCMMQPLSRTAMARAFCHLSDPAAKLVKFQASSHDCLVVFSLRR